jgi:serine/threonine protein kinase
MIAGRYTLDREIGRGGMGAVWLGRDEVLGRSVALKRVGLLPGADRADLTRAEREARLSARLNHQHVVSVFDFVADSDSDARWLVMEYVDGITLAQAVQRGGPLSPDDAAPLLWQVADALVAAHAAGIVHRDVKPSNILLDRTWRAKLTDFGIARVESDASLTQTGLLTGSPAYLAPEVVTGGRGDQAGDVWSLGATLFYMLSGQPPYAVGENVMSTLYRIVNEDPPRLAHAGRLAPLLEATLVKDPSQRWSMERVRDFLADPPAPLDDEPTQIVAPLPVASRRPDRKALVAGAGVLAVLVLGLVLWAVLLGGSTPSTDSSAPPSTASSTPSGKSTPTPVPKPSAAGMESFIRHYVAAVSADPNKSWTMLTPKFQRESGGIEKYRSFWSDATNGRVTSITADPDNLSVSYQVHFDNFDNGPGPTVLDLKFEDGHYLIDGERTKGFTPAG